jgi:HD-GYP domain-containing protein (c-di-GMP phosphodiesterase class II)
VVGLDEWTQVLAALSLATDLANGHEDERTLRSCVIAVGLGEAIGLAPPRLADVFHATLLRFIGCSSFAHEEAVTFGDDLVARHAFAEADYRDTSGLWRASDEAFSAEPAPLRRLVKRGVAVLSAQTGLSRMYATQCEVGRRFGVRLAVGDDVVDALGQIHERWDGRGGPAGLREEQIGAVVRVVQVANLAELVHRRAGVDAARDVIESRAGLGLDPTVCRAFARAAPALLEPLAAGSAWDAFAAIGRRSPIVASADLVDDVIAAFADFADLACVYTLGHSGAVADAADAAALAIGLDADARLELRRAALLHDLGRVAIPTALWEKAAPLVAADRERIRLHAYYGKRILDRAPSLRSVAAIACSDHERVDGSGYPHGAVVPRGCTAQAILAAADVWCALREDRPHRPGHTEARAKDILRDEVGAGRLDAHAVDAVLGVRERPRDVPLPAGLTPREAEVLVWVARGDTNKEVGVRLGISARTVGHHLASAYAKIGITTRGAAALFVVEHGLVRSRAPSATGG